MLGEDHLIARPQIDMGKKMQNLIRTIAATNDARDIQPLDLGNGLPQQPRAPLGIGRNATQCLANGCQRLGAGPSGPSLADNLNTRSTPATLARPPT
jgi:hypothetical protein